MKRKTLRNLIQNNYDRYNSVGNEPYAIYEADRVAGYISQAHVLRCYFGTHGSSSELSIKCSKHLTVHFSELNIRAKDMEIGSLNSKFFTGIYNVEQATKHLIRLFTLEQPLE